MLGRTLYALASLRALAAEVRRLLLPLLAHLGVSPLAGLALSSHRCSHRAARPCGRGGKGGVAVL